MASVEIHDEVSIVVPPDNWKLCFQRCTLHKGGTGTDDHGYRFIWRDPDGRLVPARGQAIIPDSSTLRNLLDKATAHGWF